jgi:diguanylate cyclase (GGDEF)-like protein
MPDALRSERRIFLAIELAGRRHSISALVAVLVSIAIFLVMLPFATRPMVHVPAFIPAYESALVISDLITAVLLFGQYNFFRSRALFVLANGYLFTAFIAFVHALTFADVFSPTGLLGAGSQSTAWLFMFWHGGFPLFVIAYALLRDQGRKSISAAPGVQSSPLHSGAGAAIGIGVVAIIALVYALTIVATQYLDFFPVLTANNRSTPTMTVIVSSFCLVSLSALVILWTRRPRTVVDLWLMVVMCAWLCDVALSAVFNAERFDLGWYAGRIYGLLAANFLLVVLLIENGTHYARLTLLSTKLSIANQSLELLSLQDGLTDLANRRLFDMYLETQIAVARRHRRTLALVLCDVDNFKAYNDHYGHQAGDECLKQIALALRACCRRRADMAARYGGEEFALILPDTDLIGAIQIAEAARDAIAKLMIPHAQSATEAYVSISGGIAVLPEKNDFTAQQLIAAADQTLYQAKQQGRNRMVSVQAELA